MPSSLTLPCTSGEKLCEEMHENKQFCAHIENRLMKIEHPMSTITSMLHEDTNKLYGVLLNQQPLEEMVEELNTQVCKVHSKMSLQKQVNVVWNVLELQMSQQQHVNDKVGAFVQLIK